MPRTFLLFFGFSLLLACTSPQKADLLLYNFRAFSYGPDSFTCEALAISGGKILDTGSEEVLRSKYRFDQEIDGAGGALYPGLHDAHAHFANMGKGLYELDLRNINSWEEGLKRIDSFVYLNPDKKWILGRGWDQNRWPGKAWPTRAYLDSLYPDRYFYLSRIDGHAALVSGSVLDLALQSRRFPGDFPESNGWLRDANGALHGVVIDIAADYLAEFIPDPTAGEWRAMILRAQDSCLKYGLTVVTDAGLPLDVALIIDSLQQENKLKMKVVVMLTPGEKELAFAREKGVYKTDRIRIGSFKLYADGALGSRGARLKQPYCDHSGSGMLIHDPSYFDSMCRILYPLHYQVNTHCIGDSANRLILETYGRVLERGNNRRWRIEHAQVVEATDRHFFGDFGIIPSVQPTHATSDMSWVEERLCANRMSGAYAFRALLNETGVLPLGTDFPVEEINPCLTMLSAVFRKNKNLEPADGFLPDESLSWYETLRGMTWDAAYAGFTESQYGSLAPGMAADLTLFDRPLQETPPEQLPEIRPAMVFIDGNVAWMRPLTKR